MPAQEALAQMYEKGEGVEQNYKKALEWYTKAAILAQFDIESHDVIPFLPVTISGKKHLFIMDTGLSVTTFDKSLRKYLGKERGSKLAITPDKLMQLKVYDAPESFVGQMKLGCEEVLCSDFTMLSLVIGKKIGGVVGMDFLKHHIIQLDYDQGKVFFFKPKTNSKSEWGQEFDVKIFDVPIFGKAPHVLGLPYIDMTILDDMKIEFMIDTGSNRSIDLNYNNFKRLMSNEQMKMTKSLSATASGLLEGDMVRYKNFSIEPFGHQNIIIDEGHLHNLIGTGYLNRYLVTFDFPNRKVYLKEGNNFNKVDEIDMSGLHILLIADNVVVHSVDPGSPAREAGIKAKDTILKVNNKDANTYGMWELRELMTSGDKQKITMTIKNSDEIKEVSFLLKKRI